MTLPILRLIQLLRILRIRLISFLEQNLKHVDQAFPNIHLADRIHNSSLNGSGHLVPMDNSSPVRRKGKYLDEQDSENEGLPASHKRRDGIREIFIADVFRWEVRARLCAEREYE